MQQVTVDGARWQQDSEGAWLALKVKSPQAAMEVCDALKPGKEYNVTIKGKGRSLDANGYCWVLLDKLAAYHGVHKQDVYRQEIRNIGGVSEVLCLREKAAETFCRGWESNGIGWMTDIGPSKIKGCVNVTVWYGSSVYDTEQMSRLIDAVVQDCKAVGIETLTPRELAALVSRWGEVSA